MKKSIIVIGIILFVLSLCSLFNVQRDNSEDIDLTPTSYEKVNYLAFGDSITEGGNLESRSQAYPNVVGDILGFRKVTNQGVGGSTLAYRSDRNCIANDVIDFVNNTSLTYQVVSITGGTNDRSWDMPLGSLSDETNETIYGSLNIIVNKIKRAYPDAFIFLMTPIKNRYSEEYTHSGYNLEDVSNAIKNIGKKYDLPVLDLYNTSQFENASCGMNASECDGTHPLKEFVAEYLAPQIADFIRDNYIVEE